MTSTTRLTEAEKIELEWESMWERIGASVCKIQREQEAKLDKILRSLQDLRSTMEATDASSGSRESRMREGEVRMNCSTDHDPLEIAVTPSQKTEKMELSMPLQHKWKPTEVNSIDSKSHVLSFSHNLAYYSVRNSARDLDLSKIVDDGSIEQLSGVVKEESMMLGKDAIGNSEEFGNYSSFSLQFCLDAKASGGEIDHGQVMKGMELEQNQLKQTECLSHARQNAPVRELSVVLPISACYSLSLSWLLNWFPRPMVKLKYMAQHDEEMDKEGLNYEFEESREFADMMEADKEVFEGVSSASDEGGDGLVNFGNSLNFFLHCDVDVKAGERLNQDKVQGSELGQYIVAFSDYKICSQAKKLQGTERLANARRNTPLRELAATLSVTKDLKRLLLQIPKPKVKMRFMKTAMDIAISGEEYGNFWRFSLQFDDDTKGEGSTDNEETYGASSGASEAEQIWLTSAFSNNTYHSLTWLPVRFPKPMVKMKLIAEHDDDKLFERNNALESYFPISGFHVRPTGSSSLSLFRGSYEIGSDWVELKHFWLDFELDDENKMFGDFKLWRYSSKMYVRGEEEFPNVVQFCEVYASAGVLMSFEKYKVYDVPKEGFLGHRGFNILGGRGSLRTKGENGSAIVGMQHGQRKVCLFSLPATYSFLALIKDLNEYREYNVDIALPQHGCSVLQCCSSHSTGEIQEKLAAAVMSQEISANGLLLAQDAFENYVVQSRLELKIPSATSKVTHQFVGSYVNLSRQKFSSPVTKKCFVVCDNETRPNIIHEVLSALYCKQLFLDLHANYVVQTALQVTEGKHGIGLVHTGRKAIAFVFTEFVMVTLASKVKAPPLCDIGWCRFGFLSQL